jgi:hypothetical protein
MWFAEKYPCSFVAIPRCFQSKFFLLQENLNVTAVFKELLTQTKAKVDVNKPLQGN